ncbi:MAG: hypothetical protein ACON39_04805 [Coraliomargaritaceae bacterium]
MPFLDAILIGLFLTGALFFLLRRFLWKKKDQACGCKSVCPHKDKDSL